MKKTSNRLWLAVLLCAGLAGCVTPAVEDSVRILRSDARGVMLHGLIDATRTTPPARYDSLAQAECARAGKRAAFAGMAQTSTFGFDVTYKCIAAK